MVVFHDRHGGKIKINLLDVLVPGVGRPAVRRESAGQVEEKKEQSSKEKSAEKRSAEPKAPRKESKARAETIKVAPSKASGVFDPAKETNECTEAQDKELLELKEAHKTWPEITAAMGKPKKVLTKRYGELMKARKQEEPHVASAPPAKERETANKTGEDVDKGKAEGKQRLVEEDNWSAIDPGNAVEMHVTRGPSQTVDGQSLDTQEILYICRMHNYFNDQKWVALSAKVFDKTGKRISPEALRQKFKDDKLI